MQAEGSVAAVGDGGRCEEYIADVAFSWLQRRDARTSPSVSLAQLSALDDRIDADLGGLRVEGALALSAIEQELLAEEPGAAFAAGVLALEGDDAQRWAALTASVAASNDAERAQELADAVEWVAPSVVRRSLLAVPAEQDSLLQWLQVAALAAHRIDGIPVFDEAMGASVARVPARAARAFGELGRTDRLAMLLEVCRDGRRSLRLPAAVSALLLGDRRLALRTLREAALDPGPAQREAMRMCLLADALPAAHDLIRQLGQALPEGERLRIIGCGLAGNARYLPWLIERMAEPATARIAAEAFALITGADFQRSDLEASPPAGIEDGPSDDPEDDDVCLAADVALAWPDVDRVKQWWNERRDDFEPEVRLFLGRPVTSEHCLQVLETGFQWQRVLAAHHWSILRPGTVLFPTGAPAWRQRALLGRE